MLRMVPRTVACLVLGVLASSEALLVGHHPMAVKTSRVGMKPRMAPLETADNVFTSRAVRLANHASALTSLAYFGLVSTTMQMPAAKMPMATLASVITRSVGPTSNADFSRLFSTLVTPAPFVFLIWPLIAALQVVTLGASILRPSLEVSSPGGPQSSLEALNTIGKGEPLSQAQLASLTLANTAAVAWLFVSSNSIVGSLPLASVCILPFVPLFAAFPLRNTFPPSPIYRPVFQVFSSFTTIASCLAFAVELQHGGRIPFFAGRQELCGSVFLALVGALVRLPNRSIARRGVTTLALSGILARRLASGVGASLLLSPTFVGASVLLGWSIKKLIKKDD